MTGKLRDDRKRYFYLVDNAVIERYLPLIGQSAFVVYSYLVYRAGAGDVAWPSYTTMQRGLGIGRAQIAAAVRVLVEQGLITITHAKRGANVYHIVDIPHACGDAVSTGTSSESEPVPNQNQFRIGTETSSGSEPELVPNRNLNNTQLTRLSAPAGAGVEARAPAHTPARARPPRGDVAAVVSIPADLSPGDEERAQLETLRIPQDWYMAKWWSLIEHYEGKPDDRRTVETWRRTCRRLIAEDWAKEVASSPDPTPSRNPNRTR